MCYKLMYITNRPDVALIAEKNPSCKCYDAQSIFNTDDLNFSQRYFTQWLEQVLGGDE